MKLITWAKRHYWDSLDKDKDLIIRHLKTFDDSEDDALDDMKEALNESNRVLELTMRLMMTEQGKAATRSMIDQNSEALAKADK